MSSLEIDTWVPIVKVRAEMKEADSFKVAKKNLTQPRNMMILKITDAEKLHKLFCLRRQFIYRSSYLLIPS